MIAGLNASQDLSPQAPGEETCGHDSGNDSHFTGSPILATHLKSLLGQRMVEVEENCSRLNTLEPTIERSQDNRRAKDPVGR